MKASSSVFVEVEASRHASNPSLAFSSSIPYLGWVELNTRGVPQVYVRHWNGSAWVRDGAAQNMDTAHRAVDPVLSSNGEIPYLAWTELNAKGIPQLYLKYLLGNQWITSGGSLNLNPAHGAANPALAATKTTLYLAWSEPDSQRVFQLYVKHLSGGDWQMDGNGPLNMAPLRDATEPAIALEGSMPYIAWMELSDQNFYQVYVKRWNGSGWESLGGSLNMDPTKHALNPSIVLFGKSPYVAWTEIDPEGVSRLYVKHWGDGTWTSDGKSLNIASMEPVRHAMSPSLLQVGSGLYVAWSEPNAKGLSQIHVKHWTADRWESDDQQLNATPVTAAVSPSLTGLGSVAYIVWKEIGQNGLFQIVVKHLQTE